MAKKSNGHIRFTRDGAFEWIDQRGEVYLAPLGNAFEVATGDRSGRWECSRAHFDRYEKVGGVFA